MSPQPTFSWTTDLGTINSTGLYTAPLSNGSAVVTVRAGGLTKTASVSITVQQVLTSLALTPQNATIAGGATQQFTAVAKDQMGNR